MPLPGDVHVNQPLTNISVAFIQDQSNFVADHVFPIVPVEKQSDRYYTYSQEDFFRDEAEERAPGTESAGTDYDVDNTPTYFCKVYAHHKDVSDPERVNSDSVLKPDEDATTFVSQKLMLRKERLWVNSYFKTGVWGIDLTGVAAGPGANQFIQIDKTDSHPITLIDAQKDAIAEKTGYMPNTLVIGAKVFTELKNHADILDRVKYTQRGIITQDILAALFGVDKVLVPYGVVNTAGKGKAGSFSFIHGKHMLLVYSAPNPGLKTPTGGYTYTWKGLFGAGAFGNRIKKFRMENLESDRIEGEMAFDQKVVSPALGIFFSGAIS